MWSFENVPLVKIPLLHVDLAFCPNFAIFKPKHFILRWMQSNAGRAFMSRHTRQTLCVTCALMNLVRNFVNSHNWISVYYELWIRASTKTYNTWMLNHSQNYNSRSSDIWLTIRLLCPPIKVAGNHVNKIHDFCKQLNFSRLGCLCRRCFALRFACLPIDIKHGKF